MDHEKHCPVGPGGDTTLINDDEQAILDRTTQGLAVEAVGCQDGELH